MLHESNYKIVHKGMVKKMAMPGDNNTPSKKAQGFISHKISKLMHEGKPSKQAVAIAYSMARDMGMKVPKK